MIFRRLNEVNLPKRESSAGLPIPVPIGRAHRKNRLRRRAALLTNGKLRDMVKRRPAGWPNPPPQKRGYYGDSRSHQRAAGRTKAVGRRTREGRRHYAAKPVRSEKRPGESDPLFDARRPLPGIKLPARRPSGIHPGHRRTGSAVTLIPRAVRGSCSSARRTSSLPPAPADPAGSVPDRTIPHTPSSRFRPRCAKAGTVRACD